MKKSILVMMVAIFALVGTASAQQKIGHINSADVVQAMPEYKQMLDDLQKLKDSYTKVLQGMYEDYDKKQKELQNMPKDTPDPIMEAKIQELQSLQQRISDFETKVNDGLSTAQQEKMKPINEKYMKTVKEVAVANGYSYILDVSSGTVPYYPEGTNDVTDLVMKKMGVTKAPATTTTPGTGTPK